MPILVPDLVRRSARSSTVAASRPAEAPCFTDRGETRPVFDPQLLQHAPDRRRADGRTGKSRSPRIRAAASPPKAMLAALGRRSGSRLAAAEQRVLPGERARPARRLAVASIGFDRRRRRAALSGSSSSNAPAAAEAFEHLLVDLARIEPRRRFRRDSRNGSSPRAATKRRRLALADALDADSA